MKPKNLTILILLISTQIFLSISIQGQISDDWKSQSTAYVIEGFTPADPDYYIWGEKSNIMHGVHLCLLNAEVIPVYIQKDINYINFTTRIGPSSALLYMLKVEVNVNDGGFSTVYLGSAKQDVVWYTSSAVLSQIGEYDLKVRVTFYDGTIRYRQYKVKVIPRSQKLFKDNAGNTLRKWEGNNPYSHNAIVFCEGFDAYNTNSQEMYYHAAADLVQCFNDHGYDVFLLDNYFGTQDIRNNAAIFSSAVQYISSIYGGKLIVAGGVSMGGAISRYALAKAEQDNDPLPVHTFIAIDAPHQGAIVSEPLQNFKKDNEGDDEFAKHALSNDAAMQLLNYNAYDPDGTIHDNFYQELNSLNGDGYPHLTKNIGVSFSTPEPNPNSGGWYKVTYHTGPLNGTIKTFDLTSAEKSAGSYLPKDLTTMSPIIKQASYWWIQLLIPGITALYYPTIEFERFADPTYITHESSLDIRNGNSLFDVCIKPEHTSWHDVLTADVLGEIINEVILTDVFIQNQNITNLHNSAGGKVEAGNHVTSLYPQGDVVVESNGVLNVFATDKVMLRPGFSAVKGSEVSIFTDPDLSFGCNNKTRDQEEEIDNGIKTTSVKSNEGHVIVNKKLIQELEATLYPNPAHEMVHIQLTNKKSAALNIEVYNMQNYLVLQKYILAGSDAEFYIGHLPGGTYIVRISDGEKSKSCRLVKM